MRTFSFGSKNSSVVVILSADDFAEAEETLFEHVHPDTRWSCDDTEGEEE